MYTIRPDRDPSQTDNSGQVMITVALDGPMHVIVCDRRGASPNPFPLPYSHYYVTFIGVVRRPPASVGYKSWHTRFSEQSNPVRREEAAECRLIRLEFTAGEPQLGREGHFRFFGKLRQASVGVHLRWNLCTPPFQ